MFCDILEQKNAFLDYKNKKLKKSKDWDFSKGVCPWFWSKPGHFSLVFLGNRGQENVFYDILERKNTFLCYKNKELKKAKNCNFSKGFFHGFGQKLAIFPKWLIHGFGPKIAIFQIFFF